MVTMDQLNPAEARAKVRFLMTHSEPSSWARWVLLALAIVFHLSMLVSWRAGFWHPFTFDSTATRGWRGWDFYAVVQAGHNARTGISVYESHNDRIDVVVPRYTPYRYLPAMACTLGVLLDLLPPLWAFRLWVVILEGVLLGCAYLSWRAGRDPAERVLLAGMWLVYTPFYLEIYLGQFSLVQAALVLLMLRGVENGWRWRHDLAWAASLLWKQNTVLLAPLWVVTRRWRALLVGALAVALATVPYMVRHPEAMAPFLGNLQSGTPSPQLGNLGVRQLLFSISSSLAPALDSGAQAAIQTVWVAIVLGGALWLTWRRGARQEALCICLWATTFFLVYHDVWEHHYVMLLPVWVTLYRRTRTRWVLLLYGLVAIWTPYVLIDPQGVAAHHTPMRWTPLAPSWLDVAYHASKALPTLVLWGCLACQMVSPAPMASVRR